MSQPSSSAGDNFLPSSDPHPELHSEPNQQHTNNNIDDSSLSENRNVPETLSSSIDNSANNNHLFVNSDNGTSSSRMNLSSNSNLRSSSSNLHSRLNDDIGRTPRHQRRSDISSVGGEQRLFNMSSDLGYEANRNTNVTAGNGHPNSDNPHDPSSGASDFDMNSSNLYNNNNNNNSSNGSDLVGSEDDDYSGPKSVIWGTSVDTSEVRKIFDSFLMNFKYGERREYEYSLLGPDAEITDELSYQLGDDDSFYLEKLKKMVQMKKINLNLDCRNLLVNPTYRKLHDWLLKYPNEVIVYLDDILKNCLMKICDYDEEWLDFRDELELKFPRVRPYNIDNKRGIRELNPPDIDKLISIKGLVLRSSAIIPDMKNAYFRCGICNHHESVPINKGVIKEPTKCTSPNCTAVNNMILVHNRCTFSDKQVIKLQETPDLVPDGQTPHSVSLVVYDELVDSCRAGDKVVIAGIFKSIPVRANPKQRALRNLFKTYVDVVHVKKISNEKLDLDTSTVEQQLLQKEMEEEEAGGSGVQEVRQLSQENIDKTKELASRYDCYEILARSIAPSIFEMDDVKKGILLQLFSGTNKTFKKGGRYRGDINILLCGDPSTSKSQILKYVHKIAPRGVYTSGKGSSAVGLTAYITRDVETKQLVLESGALVLSDGGVCCIDEFDKMNDSTRSVLHEVMEQQTISVAKAGIITTLNARTSILASANPIKSRYDPNLPVTENIDLPPPLLSRFDLVYLVLDKVDEGLDRDLATHLTNLYLHDKVENGSSQKEDIIPIEFLTMYINYAKQNVNPVLTPEAGEELVSTYVGMRRMGDDPNSDKQRITATTRQLESMIRLSEAHAKMRLSETVDIEDVKEACRLMKSAIKAYATDPKTGKIDMGLVQTGHSADEQISIENFQNWVMNFLAENDIGLNNSISIGDLAKKFKEAVTQSNNGNMSINDENDDGTNNDMSSMAGLTQSEIVSILERMSGDGDIILKNVKNQKHVSMVR
ncbi:MCM-domain-containing protein [Hanseniaspora valbyensis NRRL Y-1626]|uniref:DNA replication licensing factor MCM4 n=1 Tax=Hanseniaspora valbyensis NRRL Y-1626 TaxID=766949 RepID=A0A1B7TIM0_9ASCO|nr:MCM-domain-containing protein [Hanseniaspora valbyensis NRRL Y-1626]